MAVARWLETDTYSNKDISTAVSIGVYTADADRMIVCDVSIDQAAGNGDYVVYLTRQINGSGSSYVLLPKTTCAAASGETAIAMQSGMVTVRSGDVVTCYIDGLAGDNANPDTTVRWFELAALRPTTADRTLNVSSGGVADADMTAISTDATAANNLETMLDGTGGAELTLKKLVVNNPDSFPASAVQITAGGTGINVSASQDAVKLVSNQQRAVYMATNVGSATVYVEGPTSGYGSALALSTPSGEPPQDPAWGQLITFELQGGKPAIRVTNTDGAGNVMEVLDSANGDWVLDDTLFALPADTADAVRTELAPELARIDAATSTRLATAGYTAPLDAAGTRAAVGLSAANLDSQLSTLAAYVDTEIAAILAAVDTEIAAIKAKTDGLPAIPAGVGDAMTLANDAITAAKLAADAVAEIATAIRTELATELARIDAAISTRLATAGYTAPPAVGAVADAVLDEAMTGHTTPGTAGAALAAAGSAGDPWITDLTDGTYDDPDTAGYIVARLADLDTSAVTQVAASNAGHLTITAGLSFSESVTGLTIPADWTACYWTVKRSTDDLDADALVQILVSNPGDPDDGVQVLMGTALEDESDGSLVVNQALGTVTIALGDASTALLEDAVELVWDVKVHAPAGKTQPGAGTATITTAVTRA